MFLEWLFICNLQKFILPDLRKKAILLSSLKRNIFILKKLPHIFYFRIQNTT